MNILFEVQILLEKAGYNIRQADNSEEKILFEDDCLLGFVSMHNSLNDIITNWEEIQDNFLKNNASKLRNDLYKAWNAYSVFLTQERASPEIRKIIFDIEEDLRGTRKIIGDSINTGDELNRCLLPLLPVQKTVKLDFERSADRLQGRLNNPQILNDLSQDLLFSIIMEENK
jgi:hypothetical protein